MPVFSKDSDKTQSLITLKKSLRHNAELHNTQKAKKAKIDRSQL